MSGRTDGQVPHPARAIAPTSVATGLVVGAALLARNQELGAAVLRRGCDGGIVLVLVMLVAAGVAAGLTRATVTWEPGARLFPEFELAMAAALPAALLLGLTAPAFAGCKAAHRLADLGWLGNALLGAPGAIVAASCATAVGIAAGACICVHLPAAAMPLDPDDPLAVETAEHAERVARALDRADWAPPPPQGLDEG